jgi:hypothetical protein
MGARQNRLMSQHLETTWQGSDLVVLRDGQEVDRIAMQDIERVILVCRRGGESPGDLAFAVIETADENVLLPAESGIAGRVHFERQAMWAAKSCIYWVDEAHAPLPRRLRPGLWLLRRRQPGYTRMPKVELAPMIADWPLEGPQTWEQRKWQRIVKSRLLPPLPRHKQ